MPREDPIEELKEAIRLAMESAAKMRRILLDPPVQQPVAQKVGPTCSTCGLTLSEDADFPEKKCFLHRYRTPVRCKFGE